jgi:hypothetical protein
MNELIHAPDAAINNLCNWILQHEQNFRLSSPESRNISQAIKICGELIFILAALQKNNNHHVACNNRLILRLWEDLDNTYKTETWTTIVKMSRQHPTNKELWLLFLNAEVLSGRQFSFHDEIVQELNPLSSNENLSSSLAYSCELAGWRNAQNSSSSEISTLLLQEEPLINNWFSKLYNLTHAIFFGTDFGTRKLNKQVSLEQLKALLTQSLELCLKKQNLDLVAEIITCFVYLRLPSCDMYEKGLRRLRSNIQVNNDAPLINGNLQSHRNNYFLKHYHLILTTLLALSISKKYHHV